MIEFLQSRGAKNIERKMLPGAWSVEFVLNGETHRHAFLGGVPALPALAALVA